MIYLCCDWGETMDNGISIYAGLNCTVEENVKLIETADSLGLKRLFTSVNIPETNAEAFFDEFSAILAAALERDFEIILDVNPDNIFAFDFDELTLRLDDGFDAGQVADLSHIHRIMLNASTINEEFLSALVNLNANFSNISALHNFYPRPSTALDVNFFFKQNHLLHNFGIPTGAFVASQSGRRRPPLAEGLPTVEATRNFTVDLAARFLAALNTDFILVSDSLPTFEECVAVANIIDNEVIIQANLLTTDPMSIEFLSNSFIARAEISTDVIRAANSRSLLNGTIEPEENSQVRHVGDITIDNSNFSRYMGELQIIKNDLPADPRVNVAAKILDSDLPLIKFIRPNQSFSFRFV